ncbi:hypothetical protein DX873_00920 [Flagellimonas nanhaiensis]|uniref:Uncharacterized protein n=2 Tax=Flagellimonas nanhaiensis TaxID=2292706 RepID=A0A371JVY6_9FLAO|nr:hypothetical protein DX873_00920 [Allomuricauda nanhaiensis]
MGICAMTIALLCSVASCKPNTFDSVSKLWSHVKDEENGYHHQKMVGNVIYTLTYRPTDILVKQALGDNYTEFKVDSLRNKYGDYLYFNLSMSANDQELLNSKASDRNAFGAMVNQLAFGMAEKVHLIGQKRDTIPMADYSYPRMYGMSNSTNMLLVYPKDPRLLKGEFFHFTIEDLGFSTGEVGFKIPTKSLTNEPKLNFKV